MADIVQLEEKGNLLYPKTHVNAVDGLDRMVVKKSGNETITGVKNFKDGLQINGVSVLDVFYPIGSIFQSMKATDPSKIMGGTWERIKGKVLVGVDEADADFAAGKTGGDKTHKLTIDEMPNHSHSLGIHRGGNPTVSQMLGKNGYLWGEISTGKNSSFVGGGKPHNNLPPYVSIYIWLRTA